MVLIHHSHSYKYYFSLWFIHSHELFYIHGGAAGVTVRNSVYIHILIVFNDASEFIGLCGFTEPLIARL